MIPTHRRKRSAAAFGCSCISVLGSVCGSLVHADESGQFYGLLRGRDLTPFGSLRLDMRPAHAIAIERGSFVVATEIGYQNTWALSPEVERYLTEQEANGRRELGPEDVQAIRDLPGENYLLDLEQAVIDVTVHYKFSETMSAYLIVNAVTYDGGFLDSTIESFHDALGFSSLRLLVESELQPAGGIVGAGGEELRWPRPVRPGDELHLKSEVLEVRASKSRPTQGVIKVRTTTFNQDGEPVQILIARPLCRAGPPRSSTATVINSACGA